MTTGIIRNILNNALKFTEEGGSIRIGASLQEDRVYVTIKDSGIGMDEETLKNLFSLVDARHKSRSGTRKESGTGLGLILCKEFVRYHGGTLRADSTPGEGSSFTFDLPAAGKGTLH